MSAPATHEFETASGALAGLSAAGRTVPVALLAALPGLVYIAGFDHLAYGLGLLAGIVLAGALVAPRLAALGTGSVTDALLLRFGRAAAIAAGIVSIIVVFPLVAAELTLAAVLAEAGIGVPYLVAVVAVTALALAATLMLSERAFRRLGVTAYLLVAAGLIGPLTMLAFAHHGAAVPQIAYGQELDALSGVEVAMIENGLVDFDTFSPQVSPFLRLTRLDLFALVVSLALGMAVLVPLLKSFGTAPSPSRVAFTGAWTALFVMLLLISVPALAVYAKLGIYGAINAGTPLARLPEWLSVPLAADLAHIHGTSTAMLSEVAHAVRGGGDSTDIANQLFLYSSSMEERWQHLDDGVRAAMVAAAHALPAGFSATAVWQAYVADVLPAAAAAAGNETAVLSQAALSLHPAGLLLAVPGLAGLAGWGLPLLTLVVLVAAVTMAAALTRGIAAAWGWNGEPGVALASRTWCIVLAVAIAVVGGLTAIVRPTDILVGIVVSSLSLAAAGLLPVLTLGLAWKRATAAGAVAAIVAGASVAIYYETAIEIAPASFYNTWPGLSNAGETAIEEFRLLEEAVQDAQGDEAEAAAAKALDDWARGTPTRPGLANWAGIDPAASAVFAVPVGFVVLVLVSLVTRARTRQGEEASGAAGLSLGPG